MEDLNVVIAGAAGEGVQTVGDILAGAISSQGYAVFAWQEYESRIRGGRNSYSIRIGEDIQNAPLMRADVLLALNQGVVKKYQPLLKEGGTLIAPKQLEERMIAIAFAEIAKEEFKNKIYANTIAVGVVAGVLGIDLDALKRALARTFKEKGATVVESNLSAAELGYRRATKECRDLCPWKLPGGKGRYYLIPGNEAIPLAAAFAGCRFIAAYPMTPSTGIITFFAGHGDRLGVCAEQAEDEIAAVNMALGASYAGARAMTATSGGGFALMVEGVSLAGMTETPLVIVLAQRPGPATGLPTRTGQGELLFAIHAGHGEFPKLVLAPSDPYDAFHKIVKAFNLADKYQMPVIVLTDHFLADSQFSIPDFDLGLLRPDIQLADAEKIDEYKRYLLTDNGISPRLYPGQSKHLVGADSDEHDEEGHITEDLGKTVKAMVEKRLAKIEGLREEISPPEEISVDDADTVLVGWGSSRGALLEVMRLLKQEGTKVGMLHFTELWPLPEFSFPKGKTYITVESNAAGQLARLLRSEYGVSFRGTISRYDGLPLTSMYIRSRFDDYHG